jgi:predicted  nucleic acid-binding Zn-ribbon protein
MPHPVRLPVLQQVEFRAFSLYSNRPTQSVPVHEGVFCLAGANGLGKSTFLNAVGFGLTGVVPNPNDRFDSVNEHYRHNLDYAARYFRGRIDDADHDAAEIVLRFRAGEHHYMLTRGLFERETLRSLEITDDLGTSVLPEEVVSDEDRDQHYRKLLPRHINLGSFEQYVFMQHFVLTFDERRRLLFWDSDLMERALYVAFGIESQDAEQADKLRRQAERADSQRRNAQYQATEARTRLKALQRSTEGSQDGDDGPTGADYEGLVMRSRETEEIERQANKSLEDAQLALTRLRAEELSLRGAYEREFAERFEELADPATHPLVVATLEQQRCGLCGTPGEQVAQHVHADIEAHRCPLCSSPIESASDDADASEALQQVEQLTSQLEVAATAIRNKLDAVERLGAEAEAAHEAVVQARAAVTSFEAEHEVTPELIAGAGTGLQVAEQQLRAEIEGALQRKEEWRRKRDGYREGLRTVQAQLGEKYRAAELEFVPLFTDLAQGFLGLDLDLQLDVRKSTDVELVLTVEGTRRRALDQLSESQRYFVDIALRMALAQHMSEATSPSSLFIDTPEGSLDVAYESRAGQMFADFVGRGHNIVMTANLNASQLLRQLASRCGTERMEVVRMIDWSELSDVQAEAESLFQDAYVEIEEALEGSGAQP